MMPSHVSRAGRKLRPTVAATNDRKSPRLRTTLMEIVARQNRAGLPQSAFDLGRSSAATREQSDEATLHKKSSRKLRKTTGLTNSRKPRCLRTTLASTRTAADPECGCGSDRGNKELSTAYGAVVFTAPNTLYGLFSILTIKRCKKENNLAKRTQFLHAVSMVCVNAQSGTDLDTRSKAPNP